MALHLRRKTRSIEPVKRVIKLEGFKNALEVHIRHSSVIFTQYCSHRAFQVHFTSEQGWELRCKHPQARKLAELRSNAIAQIANGRHAAAERGAAAERRHGDPDGQANGGEERRSSEDRDTTEAIPMDIDTDAVVDSKQRRKQEKEKAKQQKLEAQRIERERCSPLRTSQADIDSQTGRNLGRTDHEKEGILPADNAWVCRRRAEKESERKQAWEEAEQKRMDRLKAVEAERAKLESEVQQAAADLQQLHTEMERLNAGKAEKVAQLKQVAPFLTWLLHFWAGTEAPECSTTRSV